MTSWPVRVERRPIKTGVEKKNQQKEERSAGAWQCLLWTIQKLKMMFLSTSCRWTAAWDTSTTPNQLFSFSVLFFPCLLFAPLILHWHFCLTSKWSAVFWATYLPPPHPSQPVSVASLFPSWRRPADLEHNSDPCGCFKHCVVVHFSHVSLKGVAASASFLKQNKICCNHELQLPPERPGSQTGSWLYIFPPDPFWHQHSKIRTADPIMQMN